MEEDDGMVEGRKEFAELERCLVSPTLLQGVGRGDRYADAHGVGWGVGKNTYMERGVYL